jgi:hypothetical protein
MERLRAVQRRPKLGLHVLRENERRSWMRVVEPWYKNRSDRSARRADSPKTLQGYSRRIIARGMASDVVAASSVVEISTGSHAQAIPSAVTLPHEFGPSTGAAHAENAEVDAAPFAIAGGRGVSMQPARAQSLRGGGRLETQEFTSDVLAPEAWRLSDAPPMKIRASAAARVFWVNSSLW